jgi:hypothetical protein
MRKPDSTEYAPYYGKYVALVPEENILAVLEAQLDDMMAFLSTVPDHQGNTRHAPYTWSIKEVVGHLIDTERIFVYRALRFARGDATPLPGFDENAYARVASFDRLALRDLIAEFDCARRSHLWLFKNLPDEAWSRSGEANGNSVTVQALAYIIVGHARHHTGILRKRLSRG